MNFEREQCGLWRNLSWVCQTLFSFCTLVLSRFAWCCEPNLHFLRYSSFVWRKVPINIKIAINAIINATYLVNSTIENKALRTNIFVYKLLFIQLDLTWGCVAFTTKSVIYMYIDNYVFESYDALMIYEPCCVLCCVLLNEGRIRINNRNSKSRCFFSHLPIQHNLAPTLYSYSFWWDLHVCIRKLSCFIDIFNCGIKNEQTILNMYVNYSLKIYAFIK